MQWHKRVEISFFFAFLLSAGLVHLAYAQPGSVSPESARGRSVRSAPGGQGAEFVIVRGGQPQVQILGPAKPSLPVSHAVRELQKYIRAMSGANLMIRGGGAPDAGSKFLLVGLGPQYLDPPNQARLAGLNPNGFIICRQGHNLVLQGKDDLGTLFAAYELLERLGVRWYFPDPVLGEVVPSKADLVLDSKEIVGNPAFLYRQVGHNDWSLKNKMNLKVQINGVAVGEKVWGEFHTFNELLPRARFAKTNPEFFSPNQLATTNPQVVEEVARRLLTILDQNPGLQMVTLGPNDGDGFDMSSAGRRYDEVGVSNDQKFSRRLLIFYNQVAQRVHQRYPQVWIRFGAYHTYARPPRDKSIRLEGRMIPWVTHYDQYCANHPIDTDMPDCPNVKFARLLREWRERTTHLFIYEYYYKVSWLGLPWPILHSIKKDIPYYSRIGAVGFYTQYEEGISFTNLLNFYIAAKLIWDPNADVNLILNDFYNSFYGKAAVPMKHYYELLEQAMTQSHRHFPGNAMPNATYVFTPEVMAQAHSYLQEAETLADDDKVRARIRLARSSFEYSERCLEFLRAYRGLMTNPLKAIYQRQKVIAMGNNLLEYIRQNDTNLKYVLPVERYLRPNGYFGRLIKRLEIPR